MTQINNDWITLSELRKGVRVQRKFAGLETLIDEQNNVKGCTVKYWERELYPNDDVIKTELKTYLLEDLAYTEVEENGITYYMEPLAVLSGFIQALGYPGIINPSRETLENIVILPLNVQNEYPLRRDTREKFLK